MITGDGFIPGERSVIIMNHRTRLDWMFLWCCLLRYSYLRLEKICLKAVLKGVPGFGESAQKFAMPFFSPVRYTLCLQPHSDKLLKIIYFDMAPKPIRDAHMFQAGQCRWRASSLLSAVGPRTRSTWRTCWTTSVTSESPCSYFCSLRAQTSQVRPEDKTLDIRSKGKLLLLYFEGLLRSFVKDREITSTRPDLISQVI